MAYKFIAAKGVEQPTPSQVAQGWASARMVTVVIDTVQQNIFIDGSLKTDADIADAVEKAAAALAAANPVKTSALKT